MIITGGFNVFSAEVEAAVLALPGEVDKKAIRAEHPQPAVIGAGGHA